MRSAQLQQQLQLNAQILTGLHEEHSKLRAERKHFNAMGDAEKAKSNNATTQEEVEGFGKTAELYYGQAAIFTPWIRKYAKKIAKLAAIQVTLKHELGCMQCLEIWVAEDEQFMAERVFDDRHIVGLGEIEEMFREDV